MPRQYSDGGRTPPGPRPSPGRTSLPNARSLKERVGALRNLRPFLAMVWRTSPHLAAASLILRIVRALLPVATLYVGKLIIDEVVLLVQGSEKPGHASAMARQRAPQPAGSSPRGGVCPCRAGGRSRPPRIPRRQPAFGTGDECLERSAHGACRDARPGRLRGRGVSGPARSSPAADERTNDADDPAVRPGAGHGDGGKLRRRTDPLRSVADRPSSFRSGAGFPGGGAFQRAELFDRLSCARRSGASSTTCGRRRPASRRPRK